MKFRVLKEHEGGYLIIRKTGDPNFKYTYSAKEKDIGKIVEIADDADPMDLKQLSAYIKREVQG